MSARIELAGPAVMAVLLRASLCALHASASEIEQVCLKSELSSVTGETIACYSDAGCKYAQQLGGEPVRDFDVGSAPYALARGKIAAIISNNSPLLEAIRKVGAVCTPLSR